MRPIDADALISNIKSEFEGAAGLMASSGALFAVMALKSAPTITIDNLRPKGQWKDNHCSACGMMPMGEEMWTNFHLDAPRFDFFMDFCPSCGADMRGGANG